MSVSAAAGRILRDSSLGNHRWSLSAHSFTYRADGHVLRHDMADMAVLAISTSDLVGGSPGRRFERPERCPRITGKVYKQVTPQGVAGVDARRATPPDLRPPRWGLAGCRQFDPSHPAVVTGEDAKVEPCRITRIFFLSGRTIETHPCVGQNPFAYPGR